MDELFAAIIGAVVGVGGTLYIESRRQKSADKKAEWSALDLLMLDIGRRRVFRVPGRVPVPQPDTSPGSDFDRMKRSILSIRDEIRTTMKAIRTSSPARGPLRAMYRACNVYLESSEAHPSGHWIAADDLRVALEAQLELIADKTRGLEFIAPGAEAL